MPPGAEEETSHGPRSVSAGFLPRQPSGEDGSETLYPDLDEWGPDKGRTIVVRDIHGCSGVSMLFVPAGYLADLPLERQPGAVLRRQSLDTERPGPHVSGKVAVVGHTPQKNGEILDLGHLLCIDTNCHGGGWLTALDVGSGHWSQANQKGEVREGTLARLAGDPATLSGQG